MHYLRGIQEEMHRDKLWRHEAFSKWVQSSQFNPTDLDRLPEMELGYANDCCNRVAPIYVLRDRFVPDEARAGIEPILGLFLVRLQNYLYKRWFRPYRSDIEYGQFLSRIFVPRPSPLPNPPCSQRMVDFVTALHSNTCARVDRAQDRAKSLADLSHDPEEQEAKLNWKPELQVCKPASIAIREQEYFILQPLFRAIAIAIRFNTAANSKDTSDVTTTSVLIVSTGVEDGLSAPISFNSISEDQRTGVLCDEEGKVTAIETTLEPAVDFLMYLEQREIAAFGLRPDPVQSTWNLEIGYCQPRDELLEIAVELGWSGDPHILRQPSSTWVDPERYLRWSGPGADADQRHHFGDFGEAGLERRMP